MAVRLSLRRAVATVQAHRTSNRKLSTPTLLPHSSTHNFHDKDQPSSVLVRDFIDSALYDPLKGYFSTNSDAVGALTQPLQFHHFHGRTSYLKYLQTLYQQNAVAWFTPVELFQPWYGYAIAEYILRCHHSELPLRIYEIGGGTGTCACNILDYIKATAPSVYETLEYVSVEISSALAEKQKSFVYRAKSHEARYRTEWRRAQDRAAWGPVDDNPCFVIMLEVVDNLPHDLVFRVDVTKPWMETWVCQSNGGLSETRRPLQDPLIKHCLRIIEKESAELDNGNPNFGFVSRFKGFLSKLGFLSDLIWVPTGCLEMLQTLHQVRPNMSLILSDFSILPDVQIPGERAPLVASKNQGLTRDHFTYLEATGNADIFFPTDFLLLQQLDHHCANCSSKSADVKRLSSIVTSRDFMKKFAQTSKTQTKDGYNPLLEDYSNTKFYLSRPAQSV